MAGENGSDIVCYYTVYHTEKTTPTMNIITITTCIFTIIFSLLGVVANGLVCLAILLNKDLHINSNILLLLLSFNDLIVAGITEPLYIVRRIMEAHQMYICWITLTYRSLWNISVGLSFQAITLISIERLFALFRPFKYKVYVTVRRLLVMTIVAAIFWVLFVLSRFIGLTTVSFYIITTPIILTCIVLIAIAHIKIFKLARWHHRQISSTTCNNEQQTTMHTLREAKITVTTAFIVGAVFLCYFPLLVIVITNVILSDKEVLFHFYILPWNDMLVFLNSVLNPLIYCWRSRELRSAIARLCHFNAKNSRVVHCDHSFTVNNYNDKAINKTKNYCYSNTNNK